MFGYEGNAKIVLQGKGEGGLSELVGNLQADQAQFGYLRVISGDSESKRAKFVLLTWCGQNVGALKRAKISVHKASVKNILKVDFHLQLITLLMLLLLVYPDLILLQFFFYFIVLFM